MQGGEPLVRGLLPSGAHAGLRQGAAHQRLRFGLQDRQGQDDDGRPVRSTVVRPQVGCRPVEPGHPLAPAPTAVSIDEQTAICTASEVLEGPEAGSGHRLRIEAVDDYLNDDLFTPVSFRLTDVSRHLPWRLRA